MKTMFKSLKVICLGAVLVTAGVIGGQIMSADSPAVAAQDQAVPLTSTGGSVFADVAERVGPAVVFIKTERKWSSDSSARYERPFDFFRELFPDQDPERERYIPGGGSGFIFDDDGRILTNYHVVRDADNITVVMDTDEGAAEVEAELVGSDRLRDIAIIKINPPKEGLKTVPLGDSENMRVGDWVMAIGTPFGQLQGTVTVGIVSAKGRNDLNIANGQPGGYQDYIQTDASINFGNSGGPLVNIRGEAIGINTAINPSGQGIGFAIPINMVKTVINQIITQGTVRYGFIGIQLQELNKTLAQGLGLEIEQGIVVEKVLENYPAEQAGIEQRDVIIEFNGKPVRDDAEFRLMVGETKIGEEVPIVVWRNGKKKELNIKIGERPDDNVVAATPAPEKETWLGLYVDDVDSRQARGRFNTARDQAGVIVLGVEEGSPADKAGIREGDVITEVYSQSVDNLEEYLSIAKKLEERKDPIAFLVKRGRSTTYVPVKPSKR